MSDSEEVTYPESYLTQAEDGIDPDKVKITWEAIRTSPKYIFKELASNWWVILIELLGTW